MKKRAIALQRRAYNISEVEFSAIIDNIPMKSTINTNIAVYSNTGRPKWTRNQTVKKLVLPEIKTKKQTKNLERQSRDLVKQNGETQKQLRTTSMVLEEIPDKTYVSKYYNYLKVEQQAIQDEENFVRIRTNIQNTMDKFAMLARQRNRSVEPPRANRKSQLII